MAITKDQLMKRSMARREDGVITVMVVVLTIAVVAAAGLVIDGGRVLAARRDATNVAAAAARTAAQEFDVTRFENNNQVNLIGTDALNVAQEILTRQGYSPSDTTITIDGATVRVEIREDVPLTLLALTGLRTRTVVGTATATLTQQP
jgi:Flp pilus assembly protein TadG